MRKQYHFRPTEEGTKIWDVDRLAKLTAEFPRQWVKLSAIKEIDECFWFNANNSKPTCRAIAGHAELIIETDFKHPIILSSDGRIMDGMHRVLKALIEGREKIQAVKFENDPEPDHIDVDENDLPY